MIRDTRRKLLKGLAVTLPAAWTRPVVDAVMLPAHAQTSAPETEPGCGADAGCYTMGSQTFSWPGGVGPFNVNVFDGDNCDGSVEGSTLLVVAEDAQSAADATPCTSVLEIETVPAPTGGCSFFECVVN